MMIISICQNLQQLEEKKNAMNNNFNKGMSYKQREEKQKDKVKTHEDHIVIMVAPKLDNIMINSDRRLFRNTGQEKKNLINQDASVSLPHKINVEKVPSVHIKSKILPGGTKWIEAKNFQQRCLFQPLSVNNFPIKDKESEYMSTEQFNNQPKVFKPYNFNSPLISFDISDKINVGQAFQTNWENSGEILSNNLTDARLPLKYSQQEFGFNLEHDKELQHPLTFTESLKKYQAQRITFSLLTTNDQKPSKLLLKIKKTQACMMSNLISI
jgi:hypothetical protein